jgi:hypothetical protein
MRRIFIAKATWLLVVAIALSDGATPAEACSGYAIQLDAVAAESEAVVYGDIVSAVSSRKSSGKILTRYEVEVTLMLAGEFDGSLLSFECLGGTTADGEGMAVSAVPTLVVGERVVLFFDQDDWQCPVSAGEQGVYIVNSSMDGTATMTDYFERAISGFSANGVVYASEQIARRRDVNSALPFEHGEPRVSVADAPVAPVELLLAEFESFSHAYVRNPRRITTSVGQDRNQVPVAPPTRRAK